MVRRALITLCFLVIHGCLAFGPSTPPKTQLEIRQIQTRVYETADTKLVLKAMLHVLQDEDYIVGNADSDLGYVTAIKEKQLRSRAPFFSSLNDDGKEERWEKLERIEATVNVQGHGKQTKVRANFRRKIIDNLGDVMEVKQIQDEKFYLEFFSKVNKGVFLQKEKI
jgi:hypothetical protein